MEISERNGLGRWRHVALAILAGCALCVPLGWASGMGGDRADEYVGQTVHYTVRPGDTLWSIAERVDGTSVDQLKRINKLEGAALRAGQQLLLPA